uniref:Transmembrane protein n=1 Tax=Elaeophora elaphi TaxID=1147741 RepID=A0A0R3RLE2_9BILA
MIICACTVLAVIDLANYNFGLYIILLCIVGLMIACAFCVANPNACKNPSWYARFCLLLQELYPEHLYRSSAATSNVNEATFSVADNNTAQRFRNENRAVIAMLAPAVHIMHHVWKGMAWVTEDVSEDERVTNCQTVCDIELISQK